MRDVGQRQTVEHGPRSVRTAELNRREAGQGADDRNQLAERSLGALFQADSHGPGGPEPDIGVGVTRPCRRTLPDLHTQQVDQTDLAVDDCFHQWKPTTGLSAQVPCQVYGDPGDGKPAKTPAAGGAWGRLYQVLLVFTPVTRPLAT